MRVLSNETTNLLGVCADADKKRLLICLECVWMQIKRDRAIFLGAYEEAEKDCCFSPGVKCGKRLF